MVCDGTFCNGTVKKPWYMTVKPIRDPDVIDPVQLLKIGTWVIEKWAEDDQESFVQHYCPDKQWKKHMDIDEVRGGYCLSCHENIPEEITGAWTLHNWKGLQAYDKDKTRYGVDPFDTEECALIEVFR
jgi:hypothetical protein